MPGHPGDGTPRRPSHRPGERGALLPALGASVLLHLAALLLIRFHTPAEAPVSSAPPVRVIRTAPAMQAFDLVQVSGDVAPIEVQLRERQVTLPVPPQARTGARAPETERTGAPVDPMSVRDRLRYRMGAADVWRPPPPLPSEEVSDQERVRRRVASQLDQYNDSIAAEAAARTRATDWTVKDADGGRWGVSPGAVHLGSVTLPLPFTLAAAPGRREEFAGRVRTWGELQDQAARVEGREVFDERVKAIRERMEKERAARGGGN